MGDRAASNRAEGDLLEALFGVDGGVEQGGRVLTGAFQVGEVVEISGEEGDDDRASI